MIRASSDAALDRSGNKHRVAEDFIPYPAQCYHEMNIPASG